MSRDKGIEVHQAVHGYRDGHEMIGSSLQLNGPSRRTMLGLSDLSGDGTARGFEEYLTGYPLEDAGLYVFARTWYAPEMPRPGCVWTHSLLIRLEDLDSLMNPGLLRSYFRRPELGQVSRTLPIITHIEPEVLIPVVDLDGATFEIVTRLFADDAPVLVFAEHHSRYEETCLQLWTQQWARLRGEFAFCTGSLEPRSIEKRPLDLQIVPLQRQRRVLRAGQQYSMISEEDIARANAPAASLSPLSGQTSLREPAPLTHFSPGDDAAVRIYEVGDSGYWRELLVQDFLHRNEPMREFLSTYTSDVPAKRVAHRNVIECWALLERLDAVSTSLRDLTTALTIGFPSPEEARKLKRAILGRDSLIRGREPELIYELLTMPSVSAFGQTDLDLRNRARNQFQSGTGWRADKIAWLLSCDQLNEFGRDWASEVVDSLTAEDLANLFYEDKELFTHLLLEKPSLAAQASFWKEPRELQRAAVHVLRQSQLGASLQQIMFSIVRADAAALVPELVRELGAHVIRYLLDGIDDLQRSGNCIDNWKWAGQLRRYDAEILAWLLHSKTPTSWTLAFAVALLGPYNSLLADTPSETFARHLADRSEVDPEISLVDFAAYCLSIGLRNFNGDAAPVAAEAFHLVHASAIRSRLSRRAWEWLGPQLPRPGRFSLESWDDGEKLRRALVDAFLRYQWNPSFLTNAIRDDQTRGWVKRFCQKFEEGRELLRQSQL